MLLTTGMTLVFGTLRQSLPLVLLAETLLAVMGVAYLLAIVRLWSLESGGLSLELEATGQAREGGTGVLTLRLVNGSRLGFARVFLRLSMGSGLRGVAVTRVAYMHAGTAATLEYEIGCARVGRWVIHGAHASVEDFCGLTRVATFLPVHHPVRVWPRQRGVGAQLPAPRRAPRLPAGAHRASRAGHGFELRELRDYVPGDPLRRVDWKATARRRVLTVREFEDEVVLNLVVITDMSSTMRGGTDGAKLNHALSIANDLCLSMARTSDRVGLVSFDDTIFAALPLGRGAAHYARAGRHLLALANVVHEGLTEASEHDVAEAVADYLLLHDRLNFRRAPVTSKDGAFAPTAEVFDLERMRHWALERVTEEGTAEEAELEASGIPIRSASALRRFARLRGVELPYRVESRLGKKAFGLAAALDNARASLRRGGVVVAVTDLGGMIDLEPVVRAVRSLAARRVRVVIAVPFTPDYTTAPEDTLGAAVFDLFAHQERGDRKAASELLRKAGATLVHVGPDMTAEDVAARAIALSQSRRS